MPAAFGCRPSTLRSSGSPSSSTPPLMIVVGRRLAGNALAAEELVAALAVAQQGDARGVAGDLGEDGLELVAQLLRVVAEVAGRPIRIEAEGAGQQDLLDAAVLELGDDRAQVALDGRGIGLGDRVVGAELEDHDIRIVGDARRRHGRDPAPGDCRRRRRRSPSRRGRAPRAPLEVRREASRPSAKSPPSTRLSPNVATVIVPVSGCRPARSRWCRRSSPRRRRSSRRAGRGPALVAAVEAVDAVDRRGAAGLVEAVAGDRRLGQVVLLEGRAVAAQDRHGDRFLVIGRAGAAASGELDVAVGDQLAEVDAADADAGRRPR